MGHGHESRQLTEGYAVEHRTALGVGIVGNESRHARTDLLAVGEIPGPDTSGVAINNGAHRMLNQLLKRSRDTAARDQRRAGADKECHLGDRARYIAAVAQKADADTD